jgi:prepilin-type N-terminal cleavage/methylation domain-containing protein
MGRWSKSLVILAMQQFNRSKAGFTLVEVLVSILMATVLVALSLQGLLTATLIQSQALRQSEAFNWIQSDLAQSRWQASRGQLAFDKNRCQASTADQGFADAVRDRLAQTDVTGTDPYQVPIQIKRNVNGQEFELSRTLSIANRPFHILGIQYQVRPHAAGALPVVSFYSEVMADAVFQCG